MSYPEAMFFDWVQGAGFYRELHQQAVELLPQGHGKHWLDVGCGPGLVTRLAAARGYEALGMDTDHAMIRRAARKPLKNGRSRFAVGDLDHAHASCRADVVSAASLLFVMPDPAAALQRLWDLVGPQGALLVVETTDQMTPRQARAISHTVPSQRRLALHLWALARRGRAIDASIFETLPARSCEHTPLLHGLVQAWVLRKGPAQQP